MNKPIANCNILDPIVCPWPGNIAENTVLTLHFDLASINAKLERPLVCMVVFDPSKSESGLYLELSILLHSYLGNLGKNSPKLGVQL